jgi:hypothetical protein
MRSQMVAMVSPVYSRARSGSKIQLNSGCGGVGAQRKRRLSRKLVFASKIKMTLVCKEGRLEEKTKAAKSRSWGPLQVKGAAIA